MPNPRFVVVVGCLVLAACPGPGIPTITPSLEPGYFPPIPPASEFDTTAERSDVRRLIVGNCPDRCRPGPLASIQPRISAASWSAEHRDSAGGEVIARIISEGGYRKFNIHDRRGGRDTVYWAVVRRGATLVSVFRSTTPGARDVVANVEVIHHGPGFFRGLSAARWLWSDTDDLAWGTCDGGACCKSDGIALAR